MAKNLQKNTKVSNMVKIVKKRGFSPIWLLPLFTAIIGIWLLFNNIVNARKTITIHFLSAQSIIPDKTRVLYKGVKIGKVKKIQFDIKGGVDVTAQIEPDATFMLKKQTKFWLVSAKINSISISGLDTFLTGSYINMSPGNGPDSTHFIAISKQPVLAPHDALLISLQSTNARSISSNSSIFYKKIKVGQVMQVCLDNSGQFVKIKAYIDKKYSHLVKKDTKFWNISGITANLSTSGLHVKLDSLTSLIAGGITFSSPQKSNKISEDSKKIYQLYDDFAQTKAGLNIELVLHDITNLPENASIKYKGFKIGQITQINYINDKKVFIAKATINTPFSHMVTKGAQFWLEKNSLSFSNIKSLSNIITGNYIVFVDNDTHTKQPTATRFIVLESHHPTPSSTKLTLVTDNATGLNAGGSVTYHGIKIGNISALNFSADGKFIETKINIETQYQYLVNRNSQFYLLSGVQIKASLLNGIKINSLPLQNIVNGGIGLYNKIPIIQKSKQKHLQNPIKFRLYPSMSMAKLGKKVFSPPKSIILISKVLPSVIPGSPVYYHKLPIGKISSFTIKKPSMIRTTLLIKSEYKYLINNKSIFWNVSGVKINTGLSGVKIQAQSILSIVSGGIAVDEGNNNIKNRFNDGTYKLFDNFEQATQKSTEITLTFDQAYALKIGSQIRLKGLTIGKITALTLNKNNKVEASLQIDQKYAKKIARKGSRFWIIRSEISLSGTKNLSTLISGVYINVLPGNGDTTIKFKGEGGAPKLKTENVGLPIVILAVNAGSTSIGSPVYHRQIQIGEVTEKKLTKNSSGVKIILNIYPQYAHLIRTNSIFWPASGFNLNVGITGMSLKSNSINSIIKGGLNMSTTDKEPLQPEAHAFTKFKIKKEIDPAWLKWQLAIPD